MQKACLKTKNKLNMGLYQYIENVNTIIYIKIPSVNFIMLSFVKQVTLCRLNLLAYSKAYLITLSVPGIDFRADDEELRSHGKGQI